MRLLFLRFSTIQRFLSKFPGFSHPEKHSLKFLNIAQFLGALNDNIYKLTLIFFLIALEGPKNANYILSAAGAIFVIPFLLFSSLAGILADRYSKNRLIIFIKTSEIVIILLGVVSFALRLKWGSYCILFLLSTHSAMFGPSKYGIIPELVPKHHVPKANGLITSFTYLAIILGTFLASFLTEMTKKNFVLVGSFCFIFAAVGFLASFGIRYTPPKGSPKKIKLFFLREILRTLIECSKKKHLLIVIISSAYFLFVGAFIQLNIIPYALEPLGLSEIYGGYLFLAIALGIALGAYFAGKVSKTQIELGLSCIACFFIAILFILLSVLDGQLYLVIFSLFALGFLGGNFTVPLDSFIQIFSPEDSRGHVIAAANFLSFLGVLLASFAIYFLNQALGLTAAKSFAVIGILTLIFSIFLILRLSNLFLSYTGKKILHKIFPTGVEHLEALKNTSRPILMFENATLFKAWLLCGVLPNINLLIPQYKKRRFPWFQNLFFSIHRIASPHKFEELIRQSKDFMDRDFIPCILLTKNIPSPDRAPSFIKDFFIKKNNCEIISVICEKHLDINKYTISFSKTVHSR